MPAYVEYVRFTCGSCANEWDSVDYPETPDGTRGKYGEGYNCPKCGGWDVSGEDKVLKDE